MKFQSRFFPPLLPDSVSGKIRDDAAAKEKTSLSINNAGSSESEGKMGKIIESKGGKAQWDRRQFTDVERL